MNDRRIRVLVVDDSIVVRKILSEALSAEGDIEVVGKAADAVIAEEMITSCKPDVLTLDIEMPRMDGISFLRRLMSSQPIPVIVVSSAAQNGCARAVEALEAGAVEVLPKPHGPYSVGDLRFSLAQKVRSASRARPHPIHSQPPVAKLEPTAITQLPAAKGPVIAIGASTGGTEAVSRVLHSMPPHSPPILVVQHIPAGFSRAFAERLNRTCSLEVKEAVDGDLLRPGLALIAPGDFHMILRNSPRGMAVNIKTGPRVCYQRPSVDVLFQSVASAAGPDSIGIILTGMGNDGAAGLLKMRQSGACTIGQDERTCVVYGMPKEAAKSGAVEQVLPLEAIAGAICKSAQRDRGGPVTARGHGS